MVCNGIFGEITWSIADMRGKSKPSNTKKMYYPKMLEVYQSCDSLYGDKENPRLVTKAKAYGCVSYHANRIKAV